jgi:HPt (histidine-containing phosphotransfer) domain-containing protein
MTAHAMKGDRERCLESGMDDYLAKPVSSREIADAIRRIFPLATSSAAVSTRSNHWTVARALAQVEGDEKLLQEIVAIFVDEAPKLLAKLREGIVSRNLELLERTAHNLKGQLGYLGASSAAQMSRELEDTGHHGDLPRAQRIVDELEKEITELMESMRQAVQA